MKNLKETLELKDISRPVPRVDAGPKARGQARFLDDIDFKDLLYARTLRSTRPRARIVSIKIPHLPAGYYIVDAKDVPGKNRVKLLIDDQPFFAEKVVNYIGEPILLVVGPRKEVILEILEQIEVKYEDMDPIFTIEDAESGSKPPIFGANNVFARYEY